MNKLLTIKINSINIMKPSKMEFSSVGSITAFGVSEIRVEILVGLLYAILYRENTNPIYLHSQ